MDAYPSLDELIWLFEVEPVVEYEDVGWPVSTATFTTIRGPWTISVDIAPYMHTVEIRLSQDGVEAVRLAMKEVVSTVALDRTHGAEALVVSFDRNSRLDALRLTLKPVVSVTFDTTRIWDA
jgi:hypothetical protein